MAAELVGGTPEEIALVRSTTEGINIVAEGFSLAAGRQCGHAGGRISCQSLSVDESGLSRRRNSARADRRRPRRSQSAGRCLRRADADRHGQLGRLCQRMAKRLAGNRGNRPSPRGAVFRRCDSSPRHVSYGCARDRNRFFGGRGTKMDARAGSGGIVLHRASISTACASAASVTAAWFMPPTTRESKSI